MLSPLFYLQKAQKWLDEKGISYTYRDIKEDHPSVEELTAWVMKSGLDIRRFFNTFALTQYAAERPASFDE